MRLRYKLLVLSLVINWCNFFKHIPKIHLQEKKGKSSSVSSSSPSGESSCKCGFFFSVTHAQTYKQPPKSRRARQYHKYERPLFEKRMLTIYYSIKNLLRQGVKYLSCRTMVEFSVRRVFLANVKISVLGK